MIILCFVNRYVYSFIESVKQPAFSSQNDHHCFEPRPVQLERTGTIKIVTISALISHFLPYFNSSVNPIIYNIMSGTIKFLILKLSFFSVLKINFVSNFVNYSLPVVVVVVKQQLEIIHHRCHLNHQVAFNIRQVQQFIIVRQWKRNNQRHIQIQLIKQIQAQIIKAIVIIWPDILKWLHTPTTTDRFVFVWLMFDCKKKEKRKEKNL